MSATLHRLTGAGPILEPIPDIIEELERLLEKAKAGDIKALAYFLIDGADGITTGWCSGCASMHQMICGASRLQFRIMKTDSEM